MRPGVGSGLLVVFLSILFSCSKDPVEPLNGNITRLLPGEWLTGIGFNSRGDALVCGGLPGRSGSLFRSSDGGATWSKTLVLQGKCFFFVRFVDDTLAYAGADYVGLWRSVDAGISWHAVDLADTVPVNEFDRPAFRDMAVQGNKLVMVGGDYGKKGVCYASVNRGFSWRFVRMDHHLAGVDFSVDGEALIAGWGYCARFDPNTVLAQQTDLRGDFFTSVVYTGMATALMTGYDGNIYKTTNHGADFTRLYGGSSCRFNHLAAIDGGLVAASDDGLLAVGNPDSESWTLKQLPSRHRILRVAQRPGGGLVALTSNGELIRTAP